MRTTLSLGLACGLWALPSLASAQTAPATPPASSTTRPAPSSTASTEHRGWHVVRENGRVIHVVEEDIHVPGEPQRPYAFAVAGRSPLGYTAVDEDRHFAPEVVTAVRREPF